MTRRVFAVLALSLPVVTAVLALLVQGVPAAAEAEGSVVRITINGPNVIPAETSAPIAGDLAAGSYLAVGHLHSCAMTVKGGIKCWGWNRDGQLGDGTQRDRRAPVNVSELASGVVAISAGVLHTCALTATGGVKCWGNNSWGQLGDGTTTQRLVPVDVSGLLSGVVAIAAGGTHTCAVTSAGGAKCWGNNDDGQLGDGTKTRRYTPADVSELTTGVAAVAPGPGHTCALTSAGGVKCWGLNAWGQLGDGTTTPRLTPVFVHSFTAGIAAITTGEGFTCGLTEQGEVNCWGLNTWGQLGDGTRKDRHTPVHVRGLKGIAAVSAGQMHTCALPELRRVKCWGRNYSGQLGNGTENDSRVPVGAKINAAVVDAGKGSHTCAISDAGRLKCWGWNGKGQLGDGTNIDRNLPMQVLNSDRWIAVP